MDYQEFLDSKTKAAPSCGFDPGDLNPMLFDFQRDIVRWACKKGRAAIFADCGLGKTPMQLEWAHQVIMHNGGGSVLIIAPLAVAQQTKREGDKFGIDVNVCRTQDDVVDGINITNYEMLHHFDTSSFIGVVLDESSILKSYTGKVRTEIIESFKDTPYRLACTATPAPNDHMELGNHSEYLGVMSRTEMLAMFFVHDGGDTSKWRLKGHARSEFWRWVASWAVLIKKPSDLGYSDEGFSLPELNIITHYVEAPNEDEDRLFSVAATSLQEQQKARRDTAEIKADFISQLVNQSDEPWLVWCDLNSESEQLSKSIPDAVEIKGSDSPDYKSEMMVRFSTEQERVIVTKPSIAGFGMNWQHCSKMAFCGLSHSYEQFYQAIRRCWRFGQECPVDVHVVVTDAEQGIVQNVLDKQKAAEEMEQGMLEYTKEVNRSDIKGTERQASPYVEDEERGDSYHILQGDSCERIKEIESDSIGLSIFSPPFASLYTYSNSDRDMGNSKDDAEFYEHFGYLISEIYRVMMPGRIVAFHCMNLPTSKERDGFIGIKDFRGDLIRAFQDAGFIYHSEVTIWKDPVTAMQRTKAIGLLNKQKNKDSCISRQGIPDYLVAMRKPGENPKPVEHTNEDFPISVWQKYASPVWMDINPSNTLQYRSARENNDERHICPLQLDVIERAVKLWSSPGDTVFSPFMGIGSEGYVSVKEGRRFIGIELKPSYFKCAANNLHIAEYEASQKTLFDFMEVR